jgi:hypothetical protein
MAAQYPSPIYGAALGLYIIIFKVWVSNPDPVTGYFEDFCGLPECLRRKAGNIVKQAMFVSLYTHNLSSFQFKLRWTTLNIQSEPGGKVNIVRGHSIGNFKQKSVYVHASNSERFPR